MAYVNVPKDLTKVKTKVALNLTKRQLICFSIAAAVGIPIYFLSKGTVGSSAAVLFMIGAMLPFFFLAMFERDGQPAEKILINILRFRLWPRVRPYKTENLYLYLEKEASQIADKTAKRPATAPARKRPAGKGK
ncbi:PrgI family protein [Christensenellaceae bacterium OttesenSCG-928-K19]|nr:PrgI family protein [Christensenellaceae bacterium OttesenSCG-928-K19]